MVLVACLGLLAVVAVPRQRDISAKTHRTEAMALAGSVQSAARLGHSLWRARGQPKALHVDRGRVAMVNGYPAAADLALLLEEPEAMAFEHSNGSWQHRDVSSDRPCAVTYAPPARSGQGPLVSENLAGC